MEELSHIKLEGDVLKCFTPEHELITTLNLADLSHAAKELGNRFPHYHKQPVQLVIDPSATRVVLLHLDHGLKQLKPLELLGYLKMEAGFSAEFSQYADFNLVHEEGTLMDVQAIAASSILLAPQLAICKKLKFNLRQVFSPEHPKFNLLPWREQAMARQKKRKMIVAVILILWCLMTFVVPYYYLSYQAARSEQQLMLFERKIALEAGHVAKTGPDIDSRAFLNILQALYASEPKGIVIKSVALQNGKFKVSADAPSNNELTVFVTALKKSPLWSKVTLLDLAEDPQTQAVAFHLELVRTSA